MANTEMTNNNQHKEIAISLNGETLADIIINFLGKKERLTYSSDEYFVLQHNDIEQFYYLIKEKISRENNVHLESFSVNFIYNDSTNRQINSIQALETFNETRDVIPHSTILTWHIITNHPEKNHIYTQKIEVLLKTQDIKSQENKNSLISISIESTNQSWANEILFIVQNHLKQITKRKNNKFIEKIISIDIYDYAKTFFHSILTPILMIEFFLLLYILIESPMAIHNKISENKEIVERASEKDLIILTLHNLDAVENAQITPKVKERIIEIKNDKNEIANKNKRKLIVIFFSSIVVAILVYLWKIIATEFYQDKSFILITPKSKVEYEKFKDKKNRASYISLSVVITTIILGLIVNALYEIIKFLI